MKKALSFTLVIPAYNEEHHLGACLDSVAAQTVKPDEVIVVDNNSTDKTADLAQKYPFVRVIQAKKQGVTYARNAGFNLAKGMLIGRIDADTVLPPTWVADRLAFYQDANNQNRAWTGGGSYYNVRLPKFFALSHRLLVFELNRVVMGSEILWGSNMVLPKSLWQKAYPLTCRRIDIHEDIDLAIHLDKLGFEVVHDPTAIAGVKLRRVRSHRQDLWDNLQWWPRTLRIHGYKLWPLSWFFGTAMVYVLSPVPIILEKLARGSGQKPIRE